MSDVAIRATDVSKVYRLYQKPAYRFLDMFGLLGARRGAYTEHAALNGVNLEISRGEKVAIIGRNGAGKSTFLKLVTNVIQPTSGRLDVRGDVHALLQIGTGFHPDFTGRQNVQAYLAQLGVTGADAERRCADAIAFAELEDYIDQPVKTYSTGMAMRLMFSASTAISPDLLVLDEVLGVGDAYFAQKSYERIRDLCDHIGSTLLLVTHDIYSATRMCDRVVWFDRGAVAMDGDATTVVKAYEESIRAQEERRLRLKIEAQLEAEGPIGGEAHVIVEIQGRDGQPQPSPVYFSSIALVAGQETLARLPLGEQGFDARNSSHLVRDGSAWGASGVWQGREARPLLNYGSPFHKVAGVLALPPGAPPRQARSLVVDYWSAERCELTLRCRAGGRIEVTDSFATTPGSWSRLKAGHAPLNAESADALITHAVGIQGAGDIVIRDFAMLDDAGERIHTVRHGDSVRFVFHVRVVNPIVCERAQVFIVVSRNNTERVCKFMTDALTFSHAEAPDARIEMRLAKMPLGRGTYSIAVEIAAAGYLERASAKFFSIDPDVYHCITHALEFTVTDSGWIGDGTLFEGEGTWTLEPVGRDTLV